MKDSSLQKIESDIMTFIRDNFLPDDEKDALTVDTPLITSGRIDSVSILLLINFLEETFDVSFDVYDIDRIRFDTVRLMAEAVRFKRGRTE